MTKKPQISLMQADVMNKIHSGSVRMKPRIYFTILWLLGIASAIAAGLTFAYLISISSYIIRIQTASTPAYGARQNLSQAIATFPWWAVILSITLSIIAVWLMRKYSRIYRYKISVVILGFLVISLLVGVGMSFANVGHPSPSTNRKNPNQSHTTDEAGRGQGFRSNQ